MVLFGATNHRAVGNNSDVLPNISLHYWYFWVRTASVIESDPGEKLGVCQHDFVSLSSDLK
jgi:hypothetical protein